MVRQPGSAPGYLGEGGRDPEEEVNQTERCNQEVRQAEGGYQEEEVRLARRRSEPCNRVW